MKRPWEQARWPEYRLSIPKTVKLECPECHHSLACDVTIDEDAGDVLDQAVAVAELDTERCEQCSKLMCPACPHARNRDGFKICQACCEQNAPACCSQRQP